jgi:plasmid stabilization system protein ParE
MKTEFLPEADLEFREAVHYYETDAPGMGMSFISEVHRAVSFISKNPYAATSVGSGIRKKVLGHFPYNLLYSVEPELIVIVAVAHQKRRPTYWQSRTKRLQKQRDRTRVSRGQD